MFYRLLLAAPLALLACAPTVDTASMDVDADGAARAAVTPPELTAVAEGLNAQQGAKLGEDLTIAGAEAVGDQLVMRFQHAQPSTAFGPAAREEYQIDVERSIPQNFCSEPALARLVETYGVSANIVTSDDQPLATVTVEDC